MPIRTCLACIFSATCLSRFDLQHLLLTFGVSIRLVTAARYMVALEKFSEVSEGEVREVVEILNVLELRQLVCFAQLKVIAFLLPLSCESHTRSCRWVGYSNT